MTTVSARSPSTARSGTRTIPPARQVGDRAEGQEAAEARATSLADQLAAADKEAKRLARRARNGVCPCCHRSFANVKKHMDNRHPTYQS